MDKQIIERAVEAAAKAMWMYDSGPDKAWAAAAWDDMGGSEPTSERADWELLAHAAVTAALAEVEASITAELEAVYEAVKPVNEYVTSKNYTTLFGGPGQVRHEVGLVMRDLAWATADRDELRATVARVEALHPEAGWCEECDQKWPCPTIKALRGESE